MWILSVAPPFAHAQALEPVRKMMEELQQGNEGPMGHLDIGPLIGRGAYGVVHKGEGLEP